MEATVQKILIALSVLAASVVSAAAYDDKVEGPLIARGPDNPTSASYSSFGQTQFAPCYPSVRQTGKDLVWRANDCAPYATEVSDIGTVLADKVAARILAAYRKGKTILLDAGGNVTNIK